MLAYPEPAGETMNPDSNISRTFFPGVLLGFSGADAAQRTGNACAIPAGVTGGRHCESVRYA